MDPKTFHTPPQPSAAALPQETPQPSVARQYQGLRYELLPPLSTGKECLHLRKLPDDAQPMAIIEFLGQHAHTVIHQGVHNIYTSEGQPSVTAMIQINSGDTAFWAVAHSHSRYMMGQNPSCREALLGVVDEMQTMLASSEPGPVPIPPSSAGELSDYNSADQPPIPTRQPAAVATPSPRVSPGLISPGMPWIPPSPTVSPETCSPTKATVTMLLVRNQPKPATVHDIMVFFNGIPGLKTDGVYMMHHVDRRFKQSAFVSRGSCPFPPGQTVPLHW